MEIFRDDWMRTEKERMRMLREMTVRASGENPRKIKKWPGSGLEAGERVGGLEVRESG